MEKIRIDYKTKRFLNEETNQKELEYMVEDQKLQLQSDILATKKDITRNQVLLEGAETEYPLDVEKIIDLELEIESLEEGLERLQNLQKELNLL